MGGLFESFLFTPEASETLGDLHVVDCMLRIEAALARAQASAALIPQEAAQSIIGTCKVELFDVPKLVRESARTRCLATPLVASLRETVALFNPQAASYVHLGCSDHDLVNTALILVMRDMLKCIELELGRTTEALLAMAGPHADTAMLHRQSAPHCGITSFGLVCCQWAAPLVQCQRRLSSASRTQRLDLGRDLPSLLDMQGKAPLVMALMAADLQLLPPSAAHPGSLDSMALACELGLLVGSLGKLVADMSPLLQLDISELTPSASAPTLAAGLKPVFPMPAAMLCGVAQSAAQRVPQQVATLLATLSQDNSPTPGSWQTRLTQWPALLTASHGISQAVAQLTTGLQADMARMRSNLDAARASVSAADAKARFSTGLMQQAATLARSDLAALRACQAAAAGPQD
ncbi:MAG: 3-carboxy-cicis-muconate cycloisomerase [Comamonadaceae bacterium]|nr:MAG: 3-carboxy-cicis-muconate cycloisomerase [Comamonadaceae bacterium]